MELGDFRESRGPRHRRGQSRDGDAVRVVFARAKTTSSEAAENPKDHCRSCKGKIGLSGKLASGI